MKDTGMALQTWYLLICVSVVILQQTDAETAISDILEETKKNMGQRRRQEFINEEFIDLKCTEDAKTTSRTFIWYAEGDKTLEETQNETGWQLDVAGNGNILSVRTWKNATKHTYKQKIFYCTDSSTGNIISVIELVVRPQQSIFGRIPLTHCPIHADYYTVLSCKGVTIEEPKGCRWHRDGEDEFIHFGQDDHATLVIGEDVQRVADFYWCECQIGDSIRTLMDFEVTDVTKNANTEITDSFYCAHARVSAANEEIPSTIHPKLRVGLTQTQNS